MEVIRYRLTTIICTVLFFLFSYSVEAQVSTLNKLDLDHKSDSLLDHEVKIQTGRKNRFLQMASLGQKFSIEGKFEESNKYFEKAYLISLDHPEKKFSEKQECYDDDHDLFMVLYFKAINYLSLGSIDDAMVECRRMDEMLKQANKKHFGRRLVAEDPMIYVIMGIIYEIDKDFDDSRISYVKAKQLFEKDFEGSAYKKPPEFLLRSIEHVSNLTGNQNYSTESSHGEMILIWHNGQCPLRKDIANDFKIECKKGDLISNDSRVELKEDCMGNILLPQYRYVQPNYWSGTLVANGHDVSCELMEDATWFSVHALQERLKEDGIHIWKHNEYWDTLPYNIYYARVPMAIGQNYFDLIMHGYGGSKIHSFSCEGDGNTRFHVFTILESHSGAVAN